MNAEEYVERGGNFFSKRNFDEAITDCIEAIQLNPDDALTLSCAYGIRSAAYTGKKDYDPAIADLEMAAKLASSNVKLQKQLQKELDITVDVANNYIIGGLLREYLFLRQQVTRIPNPGAESKKRFRSIRKFVVVLLIIGVALGTILGAIGIILGGAMGTDAWTGVIMIGLMGGLYSVFIGLILGIGIVPWLLYVKRDLKNISTYFRKAKGEINETIQEVEGKTIIGTIKSYIFAFLLTLFWKPFKLMCLLIYVCPLIGIYQIVKLRHQVRILNSR